MNSVQPSFRLIYGLENTPHPRVERNCPGLQTEQLAPMRPQGDIFMAALLFVMIESPEVYSDGSG